MCTLFIEVSCKILLLQQYKIMYVLYIYKPNGNIYFQAPPTIEKSCVRH
jgi:hypothetical protein